MTELVRSANVAPVWWITLMLGTGAFAVWFVAVTPATGGDPRLHDSFLWTTLPRMVGVLISVLLVPAVVAGSGALLRRLRQLPEAQPRGRTFALVWAVWLAIVVVSRVTLWVAGNAGTI